MGRRQNPRGYGILRRGISLGLAVAGLWVFGLTGAVDGFSTRLMAMGESATLAVAAFPLALEGSAYGLLPSSGLLQVGRTAVELKLSQEGTSGALPDIPILSQPAPIYAQGDDDGEKEPQLAPAQLEDVTDYTAQGSRDGDYIWADPIYVANRTDIDVTAEQVEEMMAEADYTLPQGGMILIIHTHGTEAYTPQGTDIYLESDPYRTTDYQQNVVAVGEEMARIFREAGYQVLHDTYLYDYPDYNSSYNNAREAEERWLEQYPDIDLILDIHRDALTAQDGTPYRLVGERENTAQLMLVVGSDDGGSYHPNWEENFALATQIQSQLVEDWGDVARPITLRSSRFNQDLSPHFLLLEVGGHGNSLQDALEGARCFAQSTVEALSQ